MREVLPSSVSLGVHPLVPDGELLPTRGGVLETSHVASVRDDDISVDFGLHRVEHPRCVRRAGDGRQPGRPVVYTEGWVPSRPRITVCEGEGWRGCGVDETDVASNDGRLDLAFEGKDLRRCPVRRIRGRRFMPISDRAWLLRSL